MEDLLENLKALLRHRDFICDFIFCVKPISNNLQIQTKTSNRRRLKFPSLDRATPEWANKVAVAGYLASPPQKSVLLSACRRIQQAVRIRRRRLCVPPFVACNPPKHASHRRNDDPTGLG